MVACPDSRPPAYQAAIGFARESRLQSLVTGFYDRGGVLSLARSIGSIDHRLARRRIDGLDPGLVRSLPSFDLFLGLENRLSSPARGRVARLRTSMFDRDLRRVIRRDRPDVALMFSDVASEFSLPECRKSGLPTLLSMVHGDVREEVEVLAREREISPDFFGMYLSDGPIATDDLRWLHERRLQDIQIADHVMVPSDHIASRLANHGLPRRKIHVIPYAADTRRFVPRPGKVHRETCNFLFAGGISQRKGLKYLLEAWRRIRRPGWTLSLLGALPRDRSALEPYRDEVEFLGRVGHSDMPAQMAEADVFVFPSLFEGSAVVTYEALACGLPSIVTAEAGSVVRDGLDGYLVPSANIESLANQMERLGNDPSLRASMARSARQRAEEFDWPRYHRSLLDLADRVA